MIKKYLTVIIFAFFLFSCKYSVSQQVAIGKWRDHLSYLHALKVIQGNNKIFCVTDVGMFSYNFSDFSLEKMSKATGLSDAGIVSAEYSKENNLLVIGYSNGNLDIIEGRTIYNFSDIKNKPMAVSKSINNILIIDNLAYLSCSFGIVVIDLIKREVKDTYIIGLNGEYININEIAFDGSYLYAASDKGVFKGLKTNPNLADFNNWTQISDLSWLKNKSFNTIAVFNQKVYTNYNSRYLHEDDTPVSSFNKDTIYTYDGTGWTKFNTIQGNTSLIKNSNNKLLIVKSTKASDGSLISSVSECSSNNVLTSISELNTWNQKNYNWAIYDNNQNLWIADATLGLSKKSNTGNIEKIFPKGPDRSNAFNIAAGGDKIWVASGSRDGSWGNTWSYGEVYSFINEEWTTYNGSNSSIVNSVRDIVKVYVNPQNSNQMFAGTCGYGVVEFNNSIATKIYNESNSSLKTIIPNAPYIRVNGLAMDQSGNLWVTNSDVSTPFSVKTPSGQWYSFPYQSEVVAHDIGEILVSKNNQKWVILPRGNGLFVFDENGTFANYADDEKKKLSILDEGGQLISNEVFSIAEDHNGTIWIGTSKGVVAYYNPENVFKPNNFYAQQIKVQSEIAGQANYLLETETVTSIAVDGANRKWFGTESAGVFLMSEDGTKQIYHFTTENSPLLSNNITSMAINGTSGEIFLGTDKGIISFRGTATTGVEESGEVLVFPNPVKPEYTGIISIRGLVTNSNVKITDIQGNIVFETKAEGGQANWNGKNFKGQKVHTGMYLIFSTNEDGSQTNVSKLLFIN